MTFKVAFADSAVAGKHYVDRSLTDSLSTVKFPLNENNVNVTIYLLDDSLQDGVSNFTVALGNPTGGGIIVSPAAAEIIVWDNGKPWSYYLEGRFVLRR